MNAQMIGVLKISGHVLASVLCSLVLVLAFVPATPQLSNVQQAYAASTSESEPNGSSSNADSIATNTKISGSFSGDGLDHDWYKFTVPSDGYIVLSFSKSNLDDSDSLVYGPKIKNSSGDVLLSVNAFRSASYTTAGIGLAKGTYYLELVGYNDIGNYSFKVSFSGSSTWEKEPNGKTGSCSAITFGKTWHGSFSGDGLDHDWYKFTTDSSAKVCIKFNKSNSDDGDGLVYGPTIKNSSGDVLFSVTAFRSASYTTAGIGLAKGTYYLELVGYDDIGNYSFSVVNDYRPDATSITSVKAGKKKATVKWSKCSNASGYQLYYKKGSGGAWKKAATTSATKYTKKSLKRGNCYYFKVRAYRNYGGKTYYSDWSGESYTYISR